MKKYIIISLLTFMLGSCSGASQEDIVTTGLMQMQKENFSLMSPENWRELWDSELSNPRTGKLALALAAQTPKDGYINNLIILEVENLLQESSKGLMENTKKWLETSLLVFKNLQEKSITFADDELWTLIQYRGKYSKTTPELSYIQTARSCDTTAYILTLSLAWDFESYDRYEYLLSSFECQ